MRRRYKDIMEKVMVTKKKKKKLLLGDKADKKATTGNTDSIIINPVYRGPFGQI